MNLLLIPKSPAMIIQNVAPGPPKGHRDGHTRNVADTDRTAQSCRQRLKMRHLALVAGVVVFAPHHIKRCPKPRILINRK